MVDLVCVIVVSLLFAADTAESVKAALEPGQGTGRHDQYAGGIG